MQRGHQLFETAYNRDNRRIKALNQRTGIWIQTIVINEAKRTTLLILALSASLASYLLINLVNTGPKSSFLEYLLQEDIIIAWLFFSILGYCSKLGILTPLTSGRTRKIFLSALGISALAFGHILLIEFLSSRFPIALTTLTQTIYIGAFLKTLSSIGLATIIAAGAFELGLLILVTTTPKKGKALTIAPLAIAHIAIITCTMILGKALVEISHGTTGNLSIIYIAKTLDFTSNHMCNAKEDESVLFLDGVQDRALAAHFPELPARPLREISTERINAYMPTNFRIVSCNPVDRSPDVGWCNDTLPRRKGYC